MNAITHPPLPKVGTAAHLSGSFPLGLSIERRPFAAGEVPIPSLPEHRITIYVGSPVRATWRSDGQARRHLQAHGDIAIVPAGLSGTWEDEDAGAALLLRLTPERLRSAALDVGINPDRLELIFHSQLRDPQLAHIGWALMTEHDADSPGGRLLTESLCTALTTCLLRYAAPPINPFAIGRGLSPQQLRRVLDYIETDLNRDLSLGRLAEETGLGMTQFKLLFKRSVSVSAHRYVVQRRVARAKDLLLRGDLPLSLIALEAGFADQGHMARWMRRILNLSPTDIARVRG